jgi:nucleotidyltransferase/DNA polymerase involved in DNA repair
MPLLAQTELTDLWGIAGRLAARLSVIGINTPFDLKRGDPRLIRERLGVVTMRLVLELRGVPCLDLERDTSPWPELLSVPPHDCSRRLQTDADAAALVDIGAFGGNAPDHILSGQYCCHRLPP